MKNVGLIGSATGKLGNTVFYTRKGVTCSRVYQPTVANPNTVRQRLARARFALAGQVGRGLIQAAEIGYADQLLAGESGYNAVVRGILDGTAITGNTPGTLDVNYTQLKMSDGILPIVPSATLNMETSLVVNVPMTDIKTYAETAATTINVPFANIGLVVVVYCPDFKASVVGQFVPASESGDFFAVQVPPAWQGLTVRVYGFYKELLDSKLTAIPTEQAPWKYPSRSGVTGYIGEGEVA